MLSLNLLFTSLLVGFAAAQNTTFNSGAVDLTTKNQWCQGELANCPLLCGGQANTQNNRCIGSTLDYTCTCGNNSSPASIAQYQGTLPNFICQATFQQCRVANPGSEACVTCGTLMPTDVKAVTPSSTAAATSSTSSSSAPATSSTAKAKGGAGRVDISGVTSVMVVVIGAAAMVL
ncbi:hypothetical protein P7C71_g862, partial [Lecanoromycetidae sp. Uapishka_2]